MSDQDHCEPASGSGQIAPGIRVITAPNDGPMTYTGTRSYLVGAGNVALIDPGPADKAHQNAIVRALEPGEQISHILVTHTHTDHSPLARRMSISTGAPVLAFGKSGDGRSERMVELLRTTDIGGGEGLDEEFEPDHYLKNGEIVQGDGWALEALHTPGHLSNHMCFSLRGTRCLFTGDHIMGWSTTLVSPPDGDMSDFMASLRLLLSRREDIYLPGHGPVVEDGHALAKEHLNHRLHRERQILAALKTGAETPSRIVEHVYKDLAPRLHGVATRNVLAHLVDLLDRGHVETKDNISQHARFAQKSLKP